MYFAISSLYFPVLISSLSFFFLPYLFHHYNLMLPYRWQMIYQHHRKEKQFVVKILYRFFLFTSLFKYSNVLFFIIWAGCFFFLFFFLFHKFFLRCALTLIYLRFTLTFFLIHNFFIFFFCFWPKILSFNIVLLLLCINCCYL